METLCCDIRLLVVLVLHSPTDAPGYNKHELFFPEEAEQKLTLSWYNLSPGTGHQ